MRRIELAAIAVVVVLSTGCASGPSGPSLRQVNMA